jgi:hypothetical protein
MKPMTQARLTHQGVNFVRDGLGEEIVIFRYPPGNECRAHTDGGISGSLYSLVVYLSDNPSNANTIFDEALFCPVEKGEALIFPHQLSHRAEAFTQVKYVLRMNIVYRRE